MHRLFAAIRPPDHIRDLLLDAMDDSADFRWQDDEQLHLTLRFMGEVDRHVAADLADALSRIRAAPFSLRISKVGTFDHRASGALWAGVEPKEHVAALSAKIERVCQQLGLPPEQRAFHPHITLARWKGRAEGIDRFIDLNAGLASDRWEVTISSSSKAGLGMKGHITKRWKHIRSASRQSCTMFPYKGTAGVADCGDACRRGDSYQIRTRFSGGM